MNKFRKFISQSGINQFSWQNPLFLALFPALIIIWLQPIKFTPLLFELYQVSQDLTIFYEDLENDGKAERFLYGNDGAEGHAHIRYYNDEEQYIGQYNLKYPKDKTRAFLAPYSADFNNDGIKDLVFMTMHEDSLFIDAFNFKTEKGIVRNRFITNIGGYNGQHLDHNVHWLGHYDTNNDGIPEIYFSVCAGFAWYPRKVFRYDFAKDALIASVNTGAGDLTGEIFEQNDSMLLVCGSAAYENIPKEYPFSYHDTTTWFFGFDKNLNLAFTPKHYGINPSGIESPIYLDGYIYYLFASNNEQPENKLFKMNWEGEVVDSIVFDFYVSKSFSTIEFKNKTRYFFTQLDEDRNMFEFDIDQFRVHKSKILKLAAGSKIFSQVDLNDDNKQELLVTKNLTKQVVVYDNRLKEQNRLDIGDFIRLITFNFSDDQNYGELIVNTESKAFNYRYHENPYYYLKIPLYFAIYFVSILFVALIQFFQNKRTQHRQAMEQQLADLQLQNLRNQLDPHFTFNVLNSVGNAIYKQDKEGAYDLFQRFTRIIRSSLMSSDKVFRSLKEELQFTQDYLEFQKLRFKERFSYSLEIEKGLDTSKIEFPKMLIQGFAENAVKHAFFGVEYTGQITIRVFRENNLLKVIIEDDGIGINHSKELKITSGTQKGELIIKEQIRQLNKLYNTNYSIQIIDKSDLDKDKTGTEIIISSSLRTLEIQ
ncbi:histidine kinase [Draconibacterium sp. IB214405]|uniref:sensor histidine kinase n=1 Tax=Draconibacterium sp. IB214405 TaxID=3097352 RepID=UPI002A0E0380|nr:histidine kinase [Draconibacterium sp. IB214405]MDX8338461.1 histidine kinase [Draconibacterium sp. IB214405]